MIEKKITLSELETYLWGAATLLRGVVDAGDYKQYIFPLLFYKRLCDVYDEEYQIALEESDGDLAYAEFMENHRFKIPKGHHWKDIRNKTKDLGNALQEGMRAIEKENQDRLYDIFGDAQWTNKDRLSDRLLKDLVEHFSMYFLTLSNVPQDELGLAYEYLIKKFADDSGHTAAEFYTNRTLVNLMTQILDVKEGESIYDPTCGSGGMLLQAALHLKNQGEEYRTLKLYGQERNLMTSSIARMNLFLHGFEDFRIIRGDTLSDPKFIKNDQLQKFDVVLANPPYSIKQWDQTAWGSDRYGRNFLGTPPQGRADYAFFQHILSSLSPTTGRCAILFPHGVLFREDEKEMRTKLIQLDLIECVLGLAPNLFYNSPMEACVVICREKKPETRKNKILFINAVEEVKRESAFSFLEEKHIRKITNAYRSFEDIENFAKVVDISNIQSKDNNLSIARYLPRIDYLDNNEQEYSMDEIIEKWKTSSKNLRKGLTDLIESLDS